MFSYTVTFLRNYYSFVKTNWVFTNNIKLFYILPFIAFVLGCMGTIYPASNDILSNVILAIFFYSPSDHP